MVIFNSKTHNLIVKRQIPSSYFVPFPTMNIYIPKYNYILIPSYNLLFDLKENKWVDSFSSSISNTYYYFSTVIEDQIIGINNNEMTVKSYNLITNQFSTLF